jgi:hypothetical protein
MLQLFHPRHFVGRICRGLLLTWQASVEEAAYQFVQTHFRHLLEGLSEVLDHWLPQHGQ